MAALAPVPKMNDVTTPGRTVTQVWFDWLNSLRAIVVFLNGTVRGGTGDPNSVVVGSIGQLWLRSDGGASTTLYVKESGTNTTTGWVAK